MAKKAQNFGNLQQLRKCLCPVTEDMALIYHLSGFSLFIAMKTNKLHLSFWQRIILFTFASDSSNLREVDSANFQLWSWLKVPETKLFSKAILNLSPDRKELAYYCNRHCIIRSCLLWKTYSTFKHNVVKQLKNEKMVWKRGEKDIKLEWNQWHRSELWWRRGQEKLNRRKEEMRYREGQGTAKLTCTVNSSTLSIKITPEFRFFWRIVFSAHTMRQTVEPQHFVTGCKCP